MKQTVKPYPDNLLDALFGGAPDFELPEDYAGSLEYVLHTLTELECKCIKLRYEQGMTFDQLGAAFGVTRERTRQVLAKAERKLRHPTRMRYITCGVKQMMANAAEAARTTAASTAAAIERVRVCGLLSDAINGVCKGDMAAERDMSDTIAILDLSVRSYNCLKRAGYDHVCDLVGLTWGKLSAIRNVGRKSADEIIEKLKPYGILITEDDHEVDPNNREDAR